MLCFAEEAEMVSKLYGGTKVGVGQYHSSAGDLAGLSQTALTTIPRTNTPVIYTYAPLGIDRIGSDPNRQMMAQGTKADIGGVGGHVEGAEEVKAAIAQYLLENNWYQDGPIFLSLMVTHTGDDVGITMTLPESIPTTVVDQLLWDAYDEGGNLSAKLGLYGVRQDLIADSFTGNLRGSGPVSVRMPIPKHPQNGSTAGNAFYADKAEPAAFNNIAKSAFLYPRFNTELMKNGGPVTVQRSAVGSSLQQPSLPDGVLPQHLTYLPDEFRWWDICVIDIVGYSKLAMSQQKVVISRLEQVISDSPAVQATKPSERVFLHIGDGVIICFRDYPERAPNVAVDIHRTYGQRRYELRIGVDSGLAASRRDRLTRRPNLYGDAVNRAAHLVSRGDPGHILVSEDLASKLGNIQTWRDYLHGPYHFIVKHDVNLTAFSLSNESEGVGNPTVPSLALGALAG